MWTSGSVAVSEKCVDRNSIRSTERITKLDRNTIMRVLVLAGERCQMLMDTRNPAAWEAVAMGKQTIKPNYRRRLLRLPDLDHCKRAVLNSLGAPASRRVYEYGIDQFIAWYCSEPRLAFNRIELPSSRPLARSLCDHSARSRLADDEVGRTPCVRFYGDRICGTSRPDRLMRCYPVST